MKTGEGKTLVATLPAYLNALTRARAFTSSRSTNTWHYTGAEEMGRVYGFLGMTTGLITHDQTKEEKQRMLRMRHHIRHEQRVRL